MIHKYFKDCRYSMSMEYHFIYLIKEKQDIDANESIYKIGKSTQENTRRVKSYPSGSHLLLQVACDNCHTMEDYLLRQFNKLFILARGREYFKGDVFKMINLIFFIIQAEVTPHNVEYIVTDNHNLSLHVTTDSHDEITYSFNNKDNILDEYNRRVERERRKYTRLEIKYNYELHTGKQLQDTILTLQDDISKKEGDDTISQLRSSIKMKDREYMKSSKRSDNMYYGLFTYMMYSMLYQIYGEPYRIVNWVLLSGGVCYLHTCR